jgi:hypothetical protein
MHTGIPSVSNSDTNLAASVRIIDSTTSAGEGSHS